MADNYHDTIYRMYESSDILFQEKQRFNSNYLAGYVVECYCKIILLISTKQGHGFSEGRADVRKFGHSINDMKDEMALISLEGCAISAYCADIETKCPTILNNWNPNKRYESDTSVLNGEAMTVDIHNEMENVMETVIQMEIDGVLE